MPYNKCFLISVSLATDDGYYIYTTTRKAFTADEARFMALHTIQTEYAPYPKFSALEDSQILCCEEVDMLYMDAICEGIP